MNQKSRQKASTSVERDFFKLLKPFASQMKRQQIFKNYQIEKVEIYHILTSTDSMSLKFIFVSGPESNISESKCREIIFEVVTSSDIYKKFDSSHPFLGNVWC